MWRCPAANQIWAAGVSYQNRTVAGWTGDAAALPYDQVGIIYKYGWILCTCTKP